MSYKSNVSIALRKQDFDKYVEMVKCSPHKDLSDLFESADISLSEDGNYVAMRFTGVEWDVTRPAVYSTMCFLSAGVCDKPYAFVRIGEDDYDMTVVHHTDFVEDGKTCRDDNFNNFLKVQRDVETGMGRTKYLYADELLKSKEERERQENEYDVLR